MDTRVSSIIAYSDFTGKSPDNVLGKTGVFSTKLLLPELGLYTKLPFFCSFFRSRLELFEGFCMCARGKRLHTIDADYSCAL